MSQERAQKIHEATMRILQNTGMRFLHPDALDILKSHGIRVEGDIAYFTEDQIMEWVGKAPSTAELYGFDPATDVILKHNQTINAPAAGPTFVLDPDGRMRDAQLDDFVKMLKLYEANSNYGINGGVPCQPKGIPTELSTLLLHFVAMQLTKKPLWTGTGTYKQMEAVVELTKRRFGIDDDELRSHPRILNIVNTNTPLQLDRNMTETMLTMLKYGQPLVVASAAMAGLTSPVTIAGTIALTNAEVISALALAQMYAPGSPVIYGSQSSGADLRSGSICIGSPEAALCYKYAGEMAHFYGIPSRAGGCLTDAKKVDAQSGYEAMMTYSACLDGDVSVVFQSAGILDSYLAASFEQMIVDFEIIDYVTRYRSEFDVDADSVPEDVIDDVAHGGQYLVEDHTLDFCHIDPFTPNISVRGSQENPLEMLDINIAKRMKQLLDSYEKPEVDPQAFEGMKDLLLDFGVEEGLVERAIIQ